MTIALVARLMGSFALAFCVTFYLVPIMRSLALRLGLVDKPDGKIKQHEIPTPYLGGVAVYTGLIVALAFTFPSADKALFVLVGASLLLLVGLFDDMAALKPYQKLLGQAVAAFFFLRAGLHVKEHFFHHYWRIPFSFLWIVAIINAFNLIDVMDGLATTTAIGVTVSFLAVAFFFGLTPTVCLLASLAGALCAFLWYNRPRASIYLGDAGSLSIGGLLAVVPFLIDWGRYTPYGLFAPLIILAIPLLEILSLVVIRTYKGIPFFLPSPDHFHQRLVRNGWRAREILWYIAALSCVLGVVSFLFVINALQLSTTFILAAIFLTAWFGVLCRVKRRF